MIETHELTKKCGDTVAVDHKHDLDQ